MKQISWRWPKIAKKSHTKNQKIAFFCITLRIRSYILLYKLFCYFFSPSQLAWSHRLRITLDLEIVETAHGLASGINSIDLCCFPNSSWAKDDWSRHQHDHHCFSLNSMSFVDFSRIRATSRGYSLFFIENIGNKPAALPTVDIQNTCQIFFKSILRAVFWDDQF